MFSELKIYSVGTVAENQKLAGPDGSIRHRLIEITPNEVAPMLNGEINSDKVEEKIKSKDSKGGEFEIKATTANSIQATWLPLGSSNRFTPPDVRRGERVVLYRFADQDKFYWTTLFDDIQLRKLETVIYAFSGTQDESVTDVTPEHYYFLEVSTHKGLVHFHTSKKNGEFTSFDIQINTKDGLIRIQDDLGQLFIFDSKESQIALKNADGCYLEINKKNATFNVPETLTIKAKNVVEEVVEKISTKAGKAITEKTGTHSLEASGAVTEKSQSHTLEASGAIKETAGGAITIKGVGVTISGPVKLST